MLRNGHNGHGNGHGGHRELPQLVIDDEANGLFRVHRSAFTDPEILDLERERIFDRCWIYVGHASEVPKPGDFVTRRVAGRPVIFTHGHDHKLHVLLNACTHRGAIVCRERNGNTKGFQCYYHGWTFSPEGELRGIPGEDAYEGTAFDKHERRLPEPPRVESYRDFVFACFDPHVESLRDYLADAAQYIDYVADQTEAGMEIVAGQQEYSMRANYKLLVENSIDGYHARTTHQRYFEYIAERGELDLQAMAEMMKVKGGRGLGGGKSLGNGHAVIGGGATSPWGRPIARWVPAFGEERKALLAAKIEKLEKRFGKEKAHMMTQSSRNLHIFPNLIINDIMAITVRTFYPVAPDYIEINAWALAPKDERPEDRALRLDNFLTFLGPGGFATPDDVEALEACQRGFKTIKESPWSDISRGMKRTPPQGDDELQMRAFWRQWWRLMNSPERISVSALPAGVGA
ncbi:MAG: Rieske 2Fe-2S domain-containing protein [SAR202 cluster bacterium]|nr:Rieske 2Fe-2S domain-containing protein [SAR202 cluster bacterium]